MIVPQAGDLLGAQVALEQAALGDEGLVEITVGVEQQGDAGEKTLAQALVGFVQLGDAMHAERAHQQQKHREQEDRQGDFPAERQVSEPLQHAGILARGFPGYRSQHDRS
ncbi:Uncharacterised protein [Pseudomonas aeruginosa]|nr:Uncharacterised protein [Pseudomonas aeruginosa]